MVSLNPAHVIIGFAIVFGTIGFLRGGKREIVVTAFLLVAMGLKRELFINLANKLYKFGWVAVEGRLDIDKTKEAFAKIGEIPAPITEEHEAIFFLGVFALLIFMAYVVGRWIFPRRPKPFGPLLIYHLPLTRRLVGLSLGAINGYLITQFLFSRLFPEATRIVLPRSQIIGYMSDKLPFILLFGLPLIFIVWGLLASSRGKE